MSVVSTTKMTTQQFLLLGDDPPGDRTERTAIHRTENPPLSFTVA